MYASLVQTIRNIGYQENFKLVYFFFIFFNGKVSCAKKNTSHAKMSQQNKNKLTLNNKCNNILYAQTSKRVKSCLFCVLVLFVRAKSFRKKNSLEIVLITSFQYTTHNCLPDNILCKIAICADYTTVNSSCDKPSDFL